MKRLLLPLLAAIALPNAVNADLGSADWPDVKTAFPIKEGKSKTIEIQNKNLNESQKNKFELTCGWFYGGGITRKCNVEFKEGRLTVNNSFGIKPAQIKQITPSFFGGITISYVDQNNSLKLARIQSSRKGEGAQEYRLYPFITRLYKWVNTGI